MSDENSPDKTSKHIRIYNDLKQSMRDGSFTEGDKIPTEYELASRYGVSRPTVTKALNRLKKEGLITRRIGSGSFVSMRQSQAGQHRLLGLIIPSLGRGEIFEPICAQIAALSEENDFSLVWGGTSQSALLPQGTLEKVVRRFIKNKVAGVFFAPMELTPEYQSTNLKIAAMLEEANIPVVLIDTDYVPFSQRSKHDLVGIDNLHGGYIATERYLSHGFGRVDFVYRPYSSNTVLLRKIGYKAALSDHCIAYEDDFVHCGDPCDKDFVKREILDKGASNILCGNDETAAALMKTLDGMEVDVPGKVRLIGFDDVYYAHSLRVPLTTIHQPCKDLGTIAVKTMMDRLEKPLAPPVTINLQGELVVRDSCGTLD